MPPKRKKEAKIDVTGLLGMKGLPLSAAQRVLEALPDLVVPEYDPRDLRYDLKKANGTLGGHKLCFAGSLKSQMLLRECSKVCLVLPRSRWM
jgi:hypothetical protein